MNPPSVALSVVLFLAVCLACTIIVEILLALVLRVRGWNLLIVVMAQVVTNPVIVLASNLVYYRVRGNGIDYLAILAVMEPVVVVVEGVMYRCFFKDYKFMNPLVLSFVLNLCSFTIGVVTGFS